MPLVCGHRKVRPPNFFTPLAARLEEELSNFSKILLLYFQPFDAMMKQLNLTVNRLQWAAHNVSVGLAPLNYGLQDSEISLLTGKRELTRTEEVSTEVRMVFL